MITYKITICPTRPGEVIGVEHQCPQCREAVVVELVDVTDDKAHVHEFIGSGPAFCRICGIQEDER